MFINMVINIKYTTEGPSSKIQQSIKQNNEDTRSPSTILAISNSDKYLTIKQLKALLLKAGVTK